jgi:hypothetical protein
MGSGSDGREGAREEGGRRGEIVQEVAGRFAACVQACVLCVPGDEGDQQGALGCGWRRPGLAWLSLVRLGASAQGESGMERGEGLAGPWPTGSAQSGRLPFFSILFSYLYMHLGYQKEIIGKLRVRYRWIPCENTFILELFFETK